MIVPRVGRSDQGRHVSVEREIVAGVLAAPAVLSEVRWLRAEDFTDPLCGELFGVARRLFEEGRPIDAVTVGIATAPLQEGERRALGAFDRACPGASPAAVSFLARRGLGARTVAEGIEDAAGLQMARHLGVYDKAGTSANPDLSMNSASPSSHPRPSDPPTHEATPATRQVGDSGHVQAAAVRRKQVRGAHPQSRESGPALEATGLLWP